MDCAGVNKLTPLISDIRAGALSGNLLPYRSERDGEMDFRIMSRTHDMVQNSARLDLRAEDENGNEVIVSARFTFTPGPDQNPDQTDADIERKARQALRDAAQFLRE